MEEIYKILPIELTKQIKKINKEEKITEIRLRNDRPAIIYLSCDEYILNYICKSEDFLSIMSSISKNSIYAIEKDIRQGFISVNGGHRIGICGEAVFDNGKLISIKNVNSMNIRVARQKIGVARKVMQYILDDGLIKNTLIISPPGTGKTTLLRDIARYLSDGVYELGFKGVNVGIVDERSEIAASINGKLYLDVGMRTDVISNIPKAKGMEMIIRSMGLKVVVTDEIGNIEDTIAIKQAITSGVKCIFTIHGFGIEDVLKKDCIKDLVDEEIFDNLIVLSNKNGIGTIEKIVRLNSSAKQEVG